MSDLECAKRILNSQEITCVICKGDTVYSSEKRGVAPIMEWIDAGIDLNGFSAADKIVGKAAALLFVLVGIKEVYAPIMSESAVGIFSKYDINFYCDTLTARVMNREGTGICPMERALAAVEEPEKALDAIKQTMASLRCH